jgi:hypothetical protein
VGLFTVALLVSAEPGQQDNKAGQPAADASKAGKAPVIEEDAAFDRYVDLDDLAEAWDDLDARALTDIGLQLAEGERVLMRSHKSISADKVLTAAARIAAEKRDTQTLQRLGRAAEMQKREQLGVLVKGGLAAAGRSRASVPGMTVQVDQVDLGDLASLRAALDQITTAKLSGDADVLALLARDARTMPRLTAVQRKLVLKAATDAQAALKDNKNDDITGVLNRLSGHSRGIAPPEKKPSEVLKVQPKVTAAAMPQPDLSLSRSSKELGIDYLPTKKGLVVEGDESVEFDDKTSLDPGDVIVRVGRAHCGQSNPNLDALIERARASGTAKLFVLDAETGKLKTIDLPAMDEDDSDDEEED